VVSIVAVVVVAVFSNGRRTWRGRAMKAVVVGG
jgi:hypothetical protein